MGLGVGGRAAVCSTTSLVVVVLMLAACTLIDTSDLSGGRAATNAVDAGSGSNDGTTPVGSDADAKDGSAINNPDAPTATSKYSSLILATPGLIGYWRLGENATSQVASSALPGGITGAIGGSVKRGASGLIANDPDTSFSFEDEIAAVMMSDNALYNFEGLLPFSVELWHSPNGLVGFEGLVQKHSDDPQKFGWVIAVDDGVGYALYRENTTGDGIETSLVPKVGSINHIVATFDGATLRLYVNGVEPKPADNANTLLPSTTNSLRFGKDMHGRLDEIAIYDRALDSKTVIDHYNAGK